MDIKTNILPIIAADADTIILYLTEGENNFNDAVKAVNDTLNGAITELIEGGDFKGESNQVAVLYTRGAMKARRVIIVGLGEQDEITVDTIRRAAANGIKKARDLKAKDVATVPVATEYAQAIVEGSLLGLYNYHGQKTNDTQQDLPESLELLVADDSLLAEVRSGAEQGRAFASGTYLSRELVNLPPNICTPEYMAQRSRDMAAEVGLTVNVLEEQQMSALKMGALLGVAQGSDTPPKLIIIEHNADRAHELDSVVLIGKGITFDTGGYSLKPAASMVGMKTDMSGGAAVIGAMRTVAELNVPLHVVGLIPAADNMINGHAYRPEEVVTASNGKTIEVISTDAEGRMLLADALVYAKRYEPVAVVDIATLTGACVVALGSASAGLFSTDDTLRDALVNAGTATGERVWPMPIFPEYSKAIKSKTADMKNTGGRMGGVGTSAAFLKNFVDFPAWAHVDMAGMAWDANDVAYIPEGATGYGARLLAKLVVDMGE